MGCLYCGKSLLDENTESLTIIEIWQKGSMKPIRKYTTCPHCEKQNDLADLLP